MSHFVVLVIGNDVEGQLAPYQENNMGDCPKQYLKFHDLEDDYLKEYNSAGNEMIELDNGTRVYPWDERFRVDGSIGTGSDTHKVPENLKRITLPFKERYATFEEFVEDWHGGKERDEQTGRYGYWENPNKKWDYWRIGGRYAGRLKLKGGIASVTERRTWDGPSSRDGFVSQARYGDIDWEGMKLDRLAQRRESWAEWEASGADPARGYFLFGIEKGMTQEQYLAQAENFSVFAVVKGGKWHERGEMGWFATVSNEKDEAAWRGALEALMDGLPDDTLLTIVDCHI